MKLPVIVTLIFASMASYAQTDSTQYSMRKAGMQLKRAEQSYQIGTVMIIGGGGISFIGTQIKSDATKTSPSKANAPFIFVGAGIALIGFIKTLGAFGHIGNAGKYLTGQGIAIPIEGKKKQ